MKQPVEVVELALPYLNLVAFSLIPLIVGWATGKHLVAIQIISMIYLIFNIFKFFGKKIN